jgi:hypothetical protein
MPQTTISLIDKTNVPKLTKGIEQAMKTGVLKVCDSGVTWIQEEIFDGQKYVGSKYYPNVKALTRAIKAKQGQERVGIITGNLRDSFDTHYSSDGLTGTIRGGGSITVNGKKVNYGKFLTRWQIDKLFYTHRTKKSREIMDKEIKKAL